MSRLAVYPGSFDPPTFGHLDIVERAASLFEHVVVALGRHPTRNALFTHEERAALLRQVCQPYDNVRVTQFDGLLVEHARALGASVVVRGLRVQTDFEYELQLAQANADLAPELDTVFLPTRARKGFISGSLVREISKYGGDVSGYAPTAVCSALKAKYDI